MISCFNRSLIHCDLLLRWCCELSNSYGRPKSLKMMAFEDVIVSRSVEHWWKWGRIEMLWKTLQLMKDYNKNVGEQCTWTGKYDTLLSSSITALKNEICEMIMRKSLWRRLVGSWLSSTQRMWRITEVPKESTPSFVLKVFKTGHWRWKFNIRLIQNSNLGI